LTKTKKLQYLKTSWPFHLSWYNASWTRFTSKATPVLQNYY